MDYLYNFFNPQHSNYFYNQNDSINPEEHAESYFHKEYYMNPETSYVPKVYQIGNKDYEYTGVELGRGATKVAKSVIELISNKEFVRSTAQIDPEDKEDIKNECLREFKIQKLFENEKQFLKVYNWNIVPSTKKRGVEKFTVISEYCNGGTMKLLLQNYLTDPKEKEQLIHVLHDIFLGMVKLEEKGVIHRDIKPDNIFLHRDDDGVLHAKIADFGFADTSCGAGSFTHGTPLYMSPAKFLRYYYETEEYSKYYRPKPVDYSERELLYEDLWAFGQIIFEILYKKNLYESNPDVPLDENSTPERLKLCINSLNQEKIKALCNQQEFSDPFAKGLQEILNQMLVLNPMRRKSRKTLYKTYCAKFNITPQIK